jgi:hypothetical protein
MKRSYIQWTREEALTVFFETEHDVNNACPTFLPYVERLQLTHTNMVIKLGLPLVSGEGTAFSSSVVDHWSPNSQAVNSLALLSKSFEIIALPNADNVSFSSIRSHIEKGFSFDEVLADSGQHPCTLQRVVDICSARDIQNTQILVLGQSLFHHLTPAAQFGLPSAWYRDERSVLGNSKVRQFSDARPALSFQSFEELESRLLR